MSLSLWQRPPAPIEADVVLVGGGVIGAATAFWLGRLAPRLRVVLLEAEGLGWGASGRNAGFLLPGTHADHASAVQAYGRERARRLWAFTEENLRLVGELRGEAFGLEMPGSVIAAGSPEEAARLRLAHALLAEDGVASETLDAEGAARRTGMAGFHGALYLPESGALDPLRFVRYLAETSGADVRPGCRVREAEPAGGGVRLALAEGGSVEAEQALFALNAYLPRVFPALGGLVRPVRAQMLCTAPGPPLLRTPVYSHEGYYYLRQRADGRVLVGGARHLHAEAEVGYADEATPAVQASLEAYLRAHLPAAEALPVERRWSGTMGFSPDGLPAWGEVPGLPGALFAAGFTGHGMGYGLRFGLLLARTLLGQKDEAADLFSAGRLGPRTISPRS